MIELKAKSRDLSEDPRDLRADGFVPAVFYGKQTQSTPVSVATVDFIKVLKKAGESSVVTLSHESGKVDVLIHDVAFDPVTDMPIHADFYVFNKNVKIEVAVPLEFIGVSPAVKDLGGLLVKVAHELKIEALPANLPPQIEVDISTLAQIGDQITASQITLPAGVALTEGSDEEVIVLVSGPKAEEEEESVPVDLSAIEVEKKGKEKNADGSEGEGEAE